MSASDFNTSNSTYRQLIGNGIIYTVPRYQRDYSWTEENWEELWQDINEGIAENRHSSHYLGYLVLQSNDDKNYNIIDGQQRLTTISLIVMAGIRLLDKWLREKNYDAENTKNRIAGLKQSYIGYYDPVLLTTRPKLNLNRNNDHYYKTNIVGLVEKLPTRNINEGERNLREATIYFQNKLAEFVASKEDKGKDIAQFIDNISDQLFFTVIKINDELNAYKVFETLNARGVQLSTTDLLKNNLFMILHNANLPEQEFDLLEDSWSAITKRIDDNELPDLLSAHWNSRHKFVRRKEIFKAIKQINKTPADAFKLLKDMQADIDSFLDLESPKLVRLDKASKSDKTRFELSSLLKLFRVKVPIPMLMAARRKLSEADYIILLRAVVVISFRYNVICRKATGVAEAEYIEVTSGINNGRLNSALDIIRAMKRLYPDQVIFKQDFEAIKFNISQNRKLIRYVLSAIDCKNIISELDYEHENITIEHILDERPRKQDWSAFNDLEIRELSNRLGNLILLEKLANNEKNQKSDFSAKKESYRNSGYHMTQNIATHYSDWTPDFIVARQKSMAELAERIWSIEELG
ncbi:MAG: DUF262 domain-containing HNH endonuclease family protein [Candidatus Pacebacteria bacterium]|nr:DUF262 domain-containing HNH endonuclease family protein [Candidatus Paceibacterota bacterium]